MFEKAVIEAIKELYETRLGDTEMTCPYCGDPLDELVHEGKVQEYYCAACGYYKSATQE